LQGDVMKKCIERNRYTEIIKGFFGKEQVKIITGIRRSGKSEILQLLKQEALNITDKNHVIFINFEDFAFDNIVSYKELHEYIAGKMKDDKKYFIFLDEIQMVADWEKAVNSLRLKNTDMYITGSNSRLLSGELATLLAGRYVAFNINTLSFSEFIQFRTENHLGDFDIDSFIKIGGFPLLSTSTFTDNQIRQIVSDIQSSAVLKDVVARNKIKNVPLLERIIAFLYDNVGNLVSIRKIVDYLKSNNGSGEHETISSYVGYLEEACIVKKVSRYDIKGKKILESNDKYYLADHSLQYAIRDMKRSNLGGILENIVYNELVGRNYTVYVGKMSKTDNREIDFVAEKINGGERIYVQVCTAFSSEETLDREFTPLTEIKDHYPKYVVTLDKYWQEDRNGVSGIHLKDFLLKESF
jgi:predicted AAA+ superfamily ATPase